MEHVSGEKITVFKVRISPVFYVYFKFALLIFYLYLYNSRVYQPSWHISFILIGHTIHLENHSIHNTDPRNPHFCHSRIHNTSSAFPYLLSDSLAHCLHCSNF